MSYQSQEPSVINYSQGGYDSYPRNSYQGQGSNPSSINYNDPRYPVPQDQNPTLHRSRFQDRRQGTNYSDYRKAKYDYKYNIYSLIDEPWNRMCEVGNCGTCPSNECIARRAPKLDWIWFL